MAVVGIGVDFGTTNSAAAVFDGERVQFARLERDGDIMPSALYLDRDLQRLTGQAAIDRYVKDNTGRTVEMIPEVIGETSVLVGDQGPGSTAPVETLTTKVYGAPIIDSGLQGRLFRGTKRLLGDPKVRRLMVFDHPFRLVALVTPILAHINKGVAALGYKAARATIGHPVNFEGRDTHKNQLATSRLAESYKYAGFEQQLFEPEPTAAALSFLHQHPDAQGENLLTLDFGGGTLDFCILRRTGTTGEYSVLATYGIPLGGDHIDQRLFRELLFPLLGKGERYTRRGFDREIDTLFPFEDYEDLLINWAVTYTLNQNRYTTPVMECLAQDGPNRIKFQRLNEMIQHNLSYLVFQSLKDFKAELSRSETATLDIPELDIEVLMSRGEFEALIAPQLQEVEAAVDHTLELAELTADQIDIVLATGGSSLIPAVRRILTDRFGDRVRDHDPFSSVAAGLAIADYQSQLGTTNA